MWEDLNNIEDWTQDYTNRWHGPLQRLNPNRIYKLI